MVKKKVFNTLLIIFLLVLSIYFVRADYNWGSTTGIISNNIYGQTTVSKGGISDIFNFTITDTGGHTLTLINITVPANYTLNNAEIAHNGTSNSTWSFMNYSVGGDVYLVWNGSSIIGINNSAINVWINATPQSNGEEISNAQWIIKINQTFLNTTYLNFSIDDIPPRISQLNLTDTTNYLINNSKDLQGGNWTTASNITIRVTSIEKNIQNIYLYYSINTSGNVNLINTTNSTKAIMSSLNTGTTRTYNATIPASSYPHNTFVSFFIWANDTVNHESNITNITASTKNYNGFVFKIDAIYPLINSVDSPLSGTNNTNNIITVNMTANDTGSGLPILTTGDIPGIRACLTNYTGTIEICGDSKWGWQTLENESDYNNGFRRYSNASFRTDGVADGNYNITFNITDIAGNSNTTKRITNIVIDNNPPTNITLYAPNGTLVNNATIYFNFSVSDTMDPTLSCILWIDGVMANSTIEQTNGTIGGTGNVTTPGFTNSVKIVATTIGAGFHTWNVTCADNANNTNATGIRLADRIDFLAAAPSGGNFTLTDTKGPTSTLTLSSSAIAKSATETLTCTGTDLISSSLSYEIKVTNPAGSISTTSGSSLSYTSTSTTGSYTANCRSFDATGNPSAWTASQTFTVSSSVTSTTSGGISSGSSSSSTPTTTEITEVESGETENLGTLIQTIANNVIMGAESVATFTMATSSNVEVAESHSVTISEITDTSVTIIVQSNPITLKLNIGDIKTVDVDGDGTSDLEITLNSITDGNADLTINTLVQVPEVEPASTPEPTLEPEAKSSTGWWIVLIIVVIGLIVWFLFKKKK